MADVTYDNITRPYSSLLSRSDQNVALGSDAGAATQNYGAKSIPSGSDLTDVWIDTWIKSIGYLPKKRGFFLDGKAGYIECMKLYVGNGGIIGGSLDIPDTTSANSFHVDTAGNTWWGGTTLATSTAKILNTGVGTFSNITITGGSVAGSTITAGSLTGSQIALATITGSNIASATITGGQIAAATISGSNIASATITASQIAALTITAAEIANLTITSGKINDVSISKLTTGTLTANTMTVGDLTTDGYIQSYGWTGTANGFQIKGGAAPSITLIGGTITSGIFQTSASVNTGIKINNTANVIDTWGDASIRFHKTATTGYTGWLGYNGTTLNLINNDSSAALLIGSAANIILDAGLGWDVSPARTGVDLGRSTYPWNIGYIDNLWLNYSSSAYINYSSLKIYISKDTQINGTLYASGALECTTARIRVGGTDFYPTTGAYDSTKYYLRS